MIFMGGHDIAKQYATCVAKKNKNPVLRRDRIMPTLKQATLGSIRQKKRKPSRGRTESYLHRDVAEVWKVIALKSLEG
jgi:hypothetical protein